MTINRLKSAQKSSATMSILRDLVTLIFLAFMSKFIIGRLREIHLNKVAFYTVCLLLALSLASGLYNIYRNIDNLKALKSLREGKAITLSLSSRQIMQKINLERNTRVNHVGLVTLSDLKEFFSILEVDKEMSATRLSQLFSSYLATDGETKVILDIYYREELRGVRILDIEVR